MINQPVYWADVIGRYASRLVNDIVSQVKQLSDDLVGLAANSVVIHDIGREGLASLDLLRRLARVVVIDIHLIR